MPTDLDPESRARALTEAFYEWEAWGRGWLRAPEPIELEPPLVVPPWHLAKSRERDDTKRQHWLKRLWRGTQEERDAEETGEHAERKLRRTRRPSFLVEMDVLPQSGSQFSQALDIVWLSWLTQLDSPLSFEVLREAGASRIRLAYESDQHSLIASSLRAVAPEVVLRPATSLREGWHLGSNRMAAQAETVTGFEFALARECLLPLATPRASALEGVLAALAELDPEESAVWQVLLEPVRRNWEDLLPWAGVGPTGHPILEDRTALAEGAGEKAGTPLFAVVVRLLTKTSDQERAFSLASAVQGALTMLSGANALVPLSDTEDEVLQEDVLDRSTRRLGMILSMPELSGLVSLPERSVNATDLVLWSDRPALPREVGVVLGSVAGEALALSTAARLKHTHIIGSTGSGKSNLLLSLITQDLEAGHGLCLIDPHGDLAEAVLARIPSHREHEVAVLDPSERGEPVIGWNVLEGSTEAEREILASDLVSVFRRLATSWGDQMTTVLSNAVLALMDSPEPATLLELRRFLSDETFRDAFLKTVRDSHLRAFWQHEWPGLLPRRPQVPILTRLDALLRHSRVRQVLCARSRSLDFRALMDSSGILVARLPQGQLGEANAALLGSLLITRLYQAALSRADQIDTSRTPFFLYVDEFHAVATPSMRTLFSGARKYGVGLTVAHHDFYQLKRAGEGLERSVLTNTHTRVAFHVDEEDARRLERGFAHHDALDLTRLPVGSSIARLGRADLDFRVDIPLVASGDPEVMAARVARVRQLSSERFGSARERPDPVESVPVAAEVEKAPPVKRDTSPTPPPSVSTATDSSAPETTESKPHPEGRGGPEHRYLQSLIRSWAQERGYLAELEVELPGGGRVDLVITPGDGEGGSGEQIAIEISVTTGIEHEVQNARKCLDAGYHHVALVSPRASFRASLHERLKGEFSADERAALAIYAPDEFLSWLQTRPRSKTRVAGYLVTTQVPSAEAESAEARRARLNQVIAGSLSRIKREGK